MASQGPKVFAPLVLCGWALEELATTMRSGDRRFGAQKVWVEAVLTRPSTLRRLVAGGVLRGGGDDGL
jgi:hypothetical protein